MAEDHRRPVEEALQGVLLDDPGFLREIVERMRTMLGELLDHMQGAEEVVSGIGQRYPEYGAMAEAVRKATDIVTMACEAEAYGQCEGGD